MKITLQDQGTMWCAVKADGLGRVARFYADTPDAAVEGVKNRPLAFDYED